MPGERGFHQAASTMIPVPRSGQYSSSSNRKSSPAPPAAHHVQDSKLAKTEKNRLRLIMHQARGHEDAGTEEHEDDHEPADEEPQTEDLQELARKEQRIDLELSGPGKSVKMRKPAPRHRPAKVTWIIIEP